MERLPAWARWAIGALIVLRLLYIAHDEIRAFPYDEAAYILQGRALYWGSGYNDWTYSRQPGFPLFIAVASALGIPLRLAFEGMWIACAMVISRACAGAGVRPGGRVLLVGLLLFHPLATELFNRALADNLYTAAWLVFTIALGSALGAESPRSTLRWSLLAAAAGAIAANTRQETVLVYALCCIAAAPLLLAAWRQRRAAPSVPALRRRLVVAVLLPLVTTFATVQAVKTANRIRIGAYVSYDWSLPGFKDLYRTLLAIPPDNPKLRVPIPADVRSRAAAASPAFARLLPIIETDPRCEPFRRAGERTTGIPGEAGSFNLWAIRQAIWIDHEFKFASAAEFDRGCRQVVAELRAAAARGELAFRWAPLSFIPPEWGQLLVEVPGAIPVCWDRMTRVGFSRAQLYPVPPDQLRAFDAMALRRSSLLLLQGPPDAGLQFGRRSAERLDSVKLAVAAAWPVVSWALLLASAGGWLAAIMARRLRRPAAPPASWWTLAGVVSASLLLRVLLVAALHATGVEATDRYSFPAAALLVVAGMLGLRAIVTGLSAPFRVRPA